MSAQSTIKCGTFYSCSNLSFFGMGAYGVHFWSLIRGLTEKKYPVFFNCFIAHLVAVRAKPTDCNVIPTRIYIEIKRYEPLFENVTLFVFEALVKLEPFFNGCSIASLRLVSS